MVPTIFSWRQKERQSQKIAAAGAIADCIAHFYPLTIKVGKKDILSIGVLRISKANVSKSFSFLFFIYSFVSSRTTYFKLRRHCEDAGGREWEISRVE
jgi:hypothetical protein